MEKCFIYTEKSHSKINFNNECWSPLVSGSNSAAKDRRFTQTPFVLKRKDAVPPLKDIAVGWPGTICHRYLKITNKFISSPK